MGRVKEAEDPYRYTDITGIEFVSTEGHPGEVTAQISRRSPDEKINLGAPEEAVGKLRWTFCKNLFYRGVMSAIAAEAGWDGINRFISKGPQLESACEAIVGALVAGYSLYKIIGRLNYLDAVGVKLNQTINHGVISSLNPEPIKR